MEGRKQEGFSSSSSFTSDLFGSKDSSVSSSSSGIFGTIFAPSSKVLGRESLRSESVEKKEETANCVWNKDTKSRSKVGENQVEQNKDINSYYNEERVQPCHLSSSIYYGGQDVYSRPQNTQNSGYSTNNKDGGEDESGSASRGNWWQGSLYY